MNTFSSGICIRPVLSDNQQAEKAQYIQALRSHQINTIVELCRIEKVFAVLGTPDCSEPMTSACT